MYTEELNQWPIGLVFLLVMMVLQLVHSRVEIAQLRQDLQDGADSHETLWEEYLAQKAKLDNLDYLDLPTTRRSHRIEAIKQDLYRTQMHDKYC